MTPDAHTPCPCCPDVVRELVVVAREHLDTLRAALLELEPQERRTTPWTAAIATGIALDGVLRERIGPWFEAHTVNQIHNQSVELADDRCPVLVRPPAEAMLPWA